MTKAEKIWGGVLLAVYLAAPASPVVLSALTLAVFWKYLGRSARKFAAHFLRSLGTAGIGFVAVYAMNALAAGILRLIPGDWANLNDQAVLDRLAAAPCGTILAVVFLSPLIEETLFRGYVFGNLREYSRWAAYLFSSVLFALAHTWPYAAGQDWRYLLLTVQYLFPGAVMAWTFERSESLWGSVLLHGIVNGLSVWNII